MTRFQLNHELRDTDEIEAELRGLGIDLDDTTESTHLILCLDAEPDQASLKLLEDLGVVVLERVDRQTYIARFAGASLGLVRGLASVIWAAPMYWRLKVDSGLLSALDDALRDDERRLPVNVTLHADAHGEPLPEMLAHARKSSTRRHRLELGVDQIEQLARIDAVRSVTSTCRAHSETGGATESRSPSDTPVDERGWGTSLERSVRLYESRTRHQDASQPRATRPPPNAMAPARRLRPTRRPADRDAE